MNLKFDDADILVQLPRIQFKQQVDDANHFDDNDKSQNERQELLTAIEIE